MGLGGGCRHHRDTMFHLVILFARYLACARFHILCRSLYNFCGYQCYFGIFGNLPLFLILDSLAFPVITRQHRLCMFLFGRSDFRGCGSLDLYRYFLHYLRSIQDLSFFDNTANQQKNSTFGNLILVRKRFLKLHLGEAFFVLFGTFVGNKGQKVANILVNL